MPCTFLVKANAYETLSIWIPAAADGHGAATRSLNFVANWYGYTVAAEGDALFARRFVGRMVSGQRGVSDPAIGA